MNQKINKMIFIAGICMIVCTLVYFALSSTIFTLIGSFQITLNEDNSFCITNAGETYTIHCDDIVYGLLSSIEENEPNSYYYITLKFCSLFPQYSILRDIKLDYVFSAE